MILHVKIYFPEAITTMLWTYALKEFASQLNLIKMVDDGITPKEMFSGTTTDITLKKHHTWGFPFYVLDTIFQANIAGLSKWEPHSHKGFYLGPSPFHAGSVALVLNPETGHLSISCGV